MAKSESVLHSNLLREEALLEQNLTRWTTNWLLIVPEQTEPQVPDHPVRCYSWLSFQLFEELEREHSLHGLLLFGLSC
jgi:hypothetical protein